LDRPHAVIAAASRALMTFDLIFRAQAIAAPCGKGLQGA
jgi:hypothetical protein